MKSVAEFRKLAALTKTDDELLELYRECVNGHEVENIGRFNMVLIENRERISMQSDFDFLKVKEHITSVDPQEPVKEKTVRRKPEPKKVIPTADDMPVKDKKDARFFDHLGNGFRSFAACCHYYGFEEHQIRNRLRRSNATLEKALTLPINSGHKFKFKPLPDATPFSPRIDHEGRKFESFKELSEYYGLSPNCIAIRLHKGWSLHDALTVPPRKCRRE